MADKEVTADEYGITIHHPPSGTYIIGWWQIEKDGFLHWFSHLSEKRWFTGDISRKFTELCGEHDTPVYFS